MYQIILDYTLNHTLAFQLVTYKQNQRRRRCLRVFAVFNYQPPWQSTKDRRQPSTLHTVVQKKTCLFLHSLQSLTRTDSIWNTDIWC